MKILTASAILFLFVNLNLTTAADTNEFSAKADAYLAKLTAAEEFSGAVLVAKNGKVVFEKGYGLANREHGISNTTATVFRLGSVTKQFTAMCIMILQEQEKLHVNDLISKYVEDCPETWSKITIHHLLTHTSGIPNFTAFPGNQRFERLPTTVEATITRFRDKPLSFEPGSRMRYSNSGYVLLGHLIEKISGISYGEFLGKEVFDPLGMKHSGYDHPVDILPNRASGYSRRGRKIVNCVAFAMDTPHAAGALYATVGDLLIWNQALNTERLVSGRSIDLMFIPFKGNYCYGWIKRDSDDRVRFEHAGGISGFATDVKRFPKEKVYVAVLSNFDWAHSALISDELAKMFFMHEKTISD